MAISTDNYLDEIGGFGRYHIFLTCLLMLIPILSAGNVLVIIFSAYTPDYTCSDVLSNSNASWPNVSQIENICDIPNITLTCTEWKFEDNIIKSNIVTEFDLVCERKWFVAIAKTVSMSGLFFGVMSSAFADKIGRKKLIWISIMVLLLADVGSALANNYWVFLCFRFIISSSSLCLHTCSFVLAIELVPSKYSAHMGALKSLFWGIGFMFLTALSYVFRARKYLELGLTAYGLLVFLVLWIVPESPKWLYAQKRIKEANEILHKIAKKNGLEFKNNAQCHELSLNEVVNKESYFRIFRYWKLSIMALVLYFCWFSVSVIYYGLTFIIGTLDGNLYSNSFFNALVEVPGAVFVIIASKFFGRKICLIWSFGIIGILLLSTLVVPGELSIVNTILGIIGKGIAVFTFCYLYIYTGEVYPTSLRTTGIAISSMFARLGGVTAPFIIEIASSNIYGLVFFGCLALLSGLMIITLYETKGRTMPQIIDDCVAQVESREIMHSKSDENDTPMLDYCNT